MSNHSVIPSLKLIGGDMRCLACRPDEPSNIGTVGAADSKGFDRHV